MTHSSNAGEVAHAVSALPLPAHDLRRASVNEDLVVGVVVVVVVGAAATLSATTPSPPRSGLRLQRHTSLKLPLPRIHTTGTTTEKSTTEKSTLLCRVPPTPERTEGEEEEEEEEVVEILLQLQGEGAEASARRRAHRVRLEQSGIMRRDMTADMRDIFSVLSRWTSRWTSSSRAWRSCARGWWDRRHHQRAFEPSTGSPTSRLLPGGGNGG